MPTDQNTQIVSNYIIEQLARGVSADEIQAQLLKAGYAKNSIKTAFTAVHAIQTPTPASAHRSVTAPVVKPKRGRIKTGWLLFKQSISILKQQPNLIRYVITSAILTLIITILAIIPMAIYRDTFFNIVASKNDQSVGITLWGYLLVFVYYLTSYTIINYYLAGLAADLFDSFQGKEQGYKIYMQMARAKLPKLIAFSLLEATVGIILRNLQERGGIFGAITSLLGSIIWSIARLFVVPIIMFTNDGPFVAVKRSAQLIAKTWGENITGRIALSTVLYLGLILIILPLSFITAIFSSELLGLWGIVIGVASFIISAFVVAIFSSTADSILNVVLYYYAQTGQLPPAFSAELINASFARRDK
jgi:hypothetical protein